MEITEDRFLECMAVDFPNFKISKSNVTHPTSQFAISFYSLILRNVIELNDPDEIWNVTEEQRNYINSYHPESVTLVQHVWIYNLHAAIKYVFNHLSANGSEFVYSDLLFPENTPRRSFVFMALMLNFYWYTNDFAIDLDPDINACVEKTNDIRNLKDDKEKLVAKLRELEFQRCQYNETNKEKKRLTVKNAEIIGEKELTMKELLEDEEGIEEKHKQAEEEKTKLLKSLTQLQNEKNYYASLVVLNENQVKDVYEKYAIEKDECVKKMNSLEKQSKIDANHVTKLKNVFELQQKLNRTLNDAGHKGKPVMGFQNLYNYIAALEEDEKKFSKDESNSELLRKEMDEMLEKKRNDYAVWKAERQSIVERKRDKIEKLKCFIEESKKKKYAQVMGKLEKGSKQAGEMTSMIKDLRMRETKLMKNIAEISSINQTHYETYSTEMDGVLNSLENIFGDQTTSVLLSPRSPVSKLNSPCLKKL